MMQRPLGYDPHHVMSVGIPVHENTMNGWVERGARRRAGARAGRAARVPREGYCGQSAGRAGRARAIRSRKSSSRPARPASASRTAPATCSMCRRRGRAHQGVVAWVGPFAYVESMTLVESAARATARAGAPRRARRRRGSAQPRRDPAPRVPARRRRVIIPEHRAAQVTAMVSKARRARAARCRSPRSATSCVRSGAPRARRVARGGPCTEARSRSSARPQGAARARARRRGQRRAAAARREELRLRGDDPDGAERGRVVQRVGGRGARAVRDCEAAEFGLAAAHDPDMGLSERRATKDFQDKHLPSFLTEVTASWPGSSCRSRSTGSSSRRPTWRTATSRRGPSFYFKPVIEALRQITRDDMGKDAVKSGLKKLEIRNSKGAYYASTAITFESGTLAIDHEMSNDWKHQRADDVHRRDPREGLVTLGRRRRRHHPADREVAATPPRGPCQGREGPRRQRPASARGRARAVRRLGRARPRRGRVRRRRRPIALLHTGGQPRTPAVAFVRVDTVLAVTVIDASVLVKAPTADTPAPSKLELARALGARADSLTTALGRALPMTAAPDLDDDGRRAVAQVLPSLTDTLRDLARRDGQGGARQAVGRRAPRRPEGRGPQGRRQARRRVARRSPAAIGCARTSRRCCSYATDLLEEVRLEQLLAVHREERVDRVADDATTSPRPTSRGSRCRPSRAGRIPGA